MSFIPRPVKPVAFTRQETMILGFISVPHVSLSIKVGPSIPKTTPKIEKKRGIIARLFGRAK